MGVGPYEGIRFFAGRLPCRLQDMQREQIVQDTLFRQILGGWQPPLQEVEFMTLNLSGELMSDDWAELYRDFGYEAGFFCPGDVRKAMAQLPDGADLVREITSNGGQGHGRAPLCRPLPPGRVSRAWRPRRPAI